MATETSLTTLTRRMCQNAFLAGVLVGVSHILLCELADAGAYRTGESWIAISIAFAGCWLIPSIWRSNREMRAYAQLRGMVPNARGLEVEIIPYGSVIAFFIGVGTFICIVGIDRFVTTELQKWGVLFCASVTLIFAIVSAVSHRQFVHRIEEALNADGGGWNTFHLWPIESFREFL